jgi:excisionase family DNA binding protein
MIPQGYLPSVTHAVARLDTLARAGVEWLPMGQTKKRAPKRSPKKKPPPTPAPTQMVTMRELSLYLNVSRKTLWKLVKAGQVPHYRVGVQYRFDVVAVKAAMARFH